MEGLIIRSLDDKTKAPGLSFWKVFGSIRPDLDRMFWCFGNQPWLGFPSDQFEELNRFESEHIEPFENEGATGVQLWRPGTLGLYADRFSEEFIEMWAMEPTHDDLARLATEWSRCGWAREDEEKFIQRHACIWLIYTDSSCWEIYARTVGLLDRVQHSLEGQAAMTVHPGYADRRGRSSGDPGDVG